jgi:hypothetical protein
MYAKKEIITTQTSPTPYRLAEFKMGRGPNILMNSDGYTGDIICFLKFNPVNNEISKQNTYFNELPVLYKDKLSLWPQKHTHINNENSLKDQFKL